MLARIALLSALYFVCAIQLQAQESDYKHGVKINFAPNYHYTLHKEPTQLVVSPAFVWLSKPKYKHELELNRFILGQGSDAGMPGVVTDFATIRYMDVAVRYQFSRVYNINSKWLQPYIGSSYLLGVYRKVATPHFSYMYTTKYNLASFQGAIVPGVFMHKKRTFFSIDVPVNILDAGSLLSGDN